MCVYMYRVCVYHVRVYIYEFSCVCRMLVYVYIFIKGNLQGMCMFFVHLCLYEILCIGLYVISYIKERVCVCVPFNACAYV